jgi:transposase
MSNKAVAQLLPLHEHTVKDLDMQAQMLGAPVLHQLEREPLTWQRLRPFEQFAALIERHWDGIAAYCEPRNKIKLGFIEGLTHKIRVIQRRAYGYWDEEYMRLKILTAFLPRK